MARLRAIVLAGCGLLLMAAGPAPDTKAADPLADLPAAAPAQSGGWQDVRVQVVARRMANLGAPMSGRLAEFPFRDGDSFQSGQVLARFVCGEQEGTLARARALLQEKREVLATNSKLHSLGTSSGLEYRVAIAQVAEAEADVQTQTAVVDNCVVKAPFSGRVAGVSARPYQFVGVGAPLMEILDDRTLDLEMIVPSRWLTWLRPGTPFGVALEETGKTYKAVVDRMSGKVDAVSQSIKVYGRLVDPAPELLAGMSGRAILEAPAEKPAPGHAG
jgi:RND family efflux transporter MFP subunit